MEPESGKEGIGSASKSSPNKLKHEVTYISIAVPLQTEKDRVDLEDRSDKIHPEGLHKIKEMTWMLYKISQGEVMKFRVNLNRFKAYETYKGWKLPESVSKMLICAFNLERDEKCFQAAGLWLTLLEEKKVSPKVAGQNLERIADQISRLWKRD